MSLHKLTAGDGYTYLTRQVAAQDATHRGYDGLGDYYSQRGESPGRWMGHGADGLPGFPADPLVAEAQMVALFGEGRHPDAAAIEARLVAGGHDVPAVLAATRLGSPYKVHTGANEFRRELAVRFEAWNTDVGLPGNWPVPEAERARIRTELGREQFTGEFGRPPVDARELAGFIARASRQATTAVAGYDATFTPVKSVSALWAVAARADAEVVEQAHAQAVAETLSWLEDNATYSRLGRNGVRQVQVRGLIAAAFTHRDSRSGDPNLHTHVAISNKVQVASGPQAGQWVALDGRPLHKYAVAASERYNTRLEALLTDRLGLAFAERPSAEPGKRGVREVVSVDARLASSWSTRRAAIDVRRGELSARFQAEHGRPPGSIEAVKLAQRATLETRQAKHEPRTLVEQRELWREQAQTVLGGSAAVQRMLAATLQRRTGREQRRSPDGSPAGAVDVDGAAGSEQLTPAWVVDTAETVLAVVQTSRATWQEAHVRAEAERQVRTAEVPLARVDEAVERVVAAALSPASSLPLGVVEPVSEPAALRRTDGSSVYASAGMQLFTSPPVVAAERALIATAQRTGGRTLEAAAVELAVAESAARGVTLNPGQVALVRELATSGARLQLALAPAGTGKTTAMAVLAGAWTGSGGTVVGLAPSAAAAAVLGAELQAPTDTIAKLLHTLDQLEPDPAGGATGEQGRPGRAPDWVQQIGPGSLVVVDEAGMAGTADLARVVEVVVARGGSVRLIGDDQQLAAVGAGGVLRDIADVAGAVTLSQVVRFTDPAEGAASLALRAGEAAAIGFYIDAGRVHVGDSGTVTDQAYTAWSTDRAAGLDALMLAPTREIAGALNARARTDRLAAAAAARQAGRMPGGPVPAPPVEVDLADGSAVSAGDTIITRRNDRRLSISATDWVKNGDRWAVEQVLPDGGLQVTHLATRRRVTLPAGYVAKHVALGYASTVHAAQGSTTGVCHTVAAGGESRQLLYVAMTRGRTANHLYLTAAGDGDEHSVITPEALHPPTAVDLLGKILARDGAQTSATTAQRALADPASRLSAAAGRFHDSLALAAETTLGADRIDALAGAAEAAVPGLTASASWPTLRAHLALLELTGQDAAAALVDVVHRRELSTSRDPGAVLDWRLDASGGHSAGVGPLPWLPAVPAALADDPTWGSYLAGRDRHTRQLAAGVAARAADWTPTSAPAWALPLLPSNTSPEVGTSGLVAHLAVWRAAHGIDDADLRPTGPPQLAAADLRAQRRLDTAVQQALGDPAGAAAHWRTLAKQLESRLLDDAFWPQLADRLATADRAGIDIAALARTAAEQGPLPDELPGAALWWRLSRHLSPAALDAHHSSTVANTSGATASTLRPGWTPLLANLVGADVARRVLADPAWPALVAAVTDATAHGWTPEQVLTTAYELLGGAHGDVADDRTGAPLRPGELATALVWRVGMLADPEPFHPVQWDPTDEPAPEEPDPDPALDPDQAPETDEQLVDDLPPDLDLLPDLIVLPGEQDWAHEVDAPEPPPNPEQLPPDPQAHPAVDHDEVRHVQQPADARRACDDARGATEPGPTEPGPTEPGPTLPGVVARERVLELNEQALAFFANAYRGSWAQDHLRERLGNDLTEDARFTPGYAPAGWTGLTDHLRGLGASDTELLAAGLSTTARTGRLIDRFRDRLVLPIQDGPEDIVGFIGRRNPNTPDAGPKYLNTGENAAFHKGAQLYGMAEAAAELTAGATPVLVEGPLDAIAVTLAAGQHDKHGRVGVAPLGTAFTDLQADALRPYLGDGQPGVIVATDADQAGHKAAVRAYWQLTARGGNPTHLVMPDGHDPASLLQTGGPDALREALADPPTLARTLIDARVAQFADRLLDVEGPVLAVRAAADVIGALPPQHWLDHIDYLNTIVQTAPGEAHLAVLDAGHAWTADPDAFTRSKGTAQPSVAAPASAPQEPQATPEAEQPATRDATDLLVEQWAGDVWVDVGRSIDPRLVEGPDWAGLAAALERAARAGYDVQQHLPRLAAHNPLPEDRPARALHYRLVDACPAAITPLPARLQQADEQGRRAASQQRLAAKAKTHDDQCRLPETAAPSPGRSDADHAAPAARMHAEDRARDNRRSTPDPAPSSDAAKPSRTPSAGHEPRPASPGTPDQRRGPQR